MASQIETLLNVIETAIYGRDMRSAIHDSIELCYDDVSTAKTISENATAAAEVATANAIAATTDTIAATTDTVAATNNANEQADYAEAQGDYAKDQGDATYAAIQTANEQATYAKDYGDYAKAQGNYAKTQGDSASEKAALADQKATAANNAANIADAKAALADQKATAANSAANYANEKAVEANSAAIDAANATAQAITATTNANTATTNANTARDRATSAARDANDAAIAATSAATSATSAKDRAIAAAESAETAASAATAAKNDAITATTNANTARDRANAAADLLDLLTVTAEDIPYTEDADAEISTIDGHKNIHFLLRQGQPGPAYLIKGHAYETLSDLESDITDPEIGDQYNVGSSYPYNVYRWTGTTWEDQGLIGSGIEQITVSEINTLDNGGSISGGNSKALGVTGLTYIIQTLLVNKLNNKVTVVSGKGLSTNDFTTAYKNQIDTNTSAISTLDSSKVSKETGKGLSTNDFTTAYKNQISSNTSAISTLDSSKVSKETGKGLSTNDFTNSYKTKLDGIAAGATNVTVDISLQSGSTNPVENGVITTALGNKQDKNIYFTGPFTITWADDPESLSTEFVKRGTITTTGVTSAMYPEVTFGIEDAMGGNYAPICKAGNNCVYIYAASQPSSVSIQTIAVTK